MAHDILFGTSSRDWSRSVKPTAAVSGAPTSCKIALGGMVLGTFLGLALITSPWWSDLRKPYHHTDWTGKRLPKSRHVIS